MQKLPTIRILENEPNKKGDLFAKLMEALFFSLGYQDFRTAIHKTGREIDIEATHRTELNKLSIADPNHIDFDPLGFDAYDKHDPFKYQQGIYSRIKPSESMPQPVFDKLRPGFHNI